VALWVGLRPCAAAASPPGVGAPLLESHASAARKRSTPRATRRAAGQAKNSRSTRAAAFGGVWRLGGQTAGGGSEHVCALGGGSSCLAAYVAVGLRGVAAPVLWSCTFAALSPHFSQRATRPRSGRGATLTAQRRVAHLVECSGKWREQQVQEQEVWLERSRLWHDTLIPDPDA
jgi:hypothetical protein